jgi:hypothetical protein
LQSAETVLGVLRDRGRKGLPCNELYRQMFNRDLYLLAYGRIYANQGAMIPGAGAETADGMSEDKIDQMLAVTRSEDQTSLTMPTIKGHSSRRILVVARRESRSVLLAALRGLHLDSLLGDDRRRLDRGMDVRALSDALVCIRSDEQQTRVNP